MQVGAMIDLRGTFVLLSATAMREHIRDRLSTLTIEHHGKQLTIDIHSQITGAAAIQLEIGLTSIMTPPFWHAHTDEPNRKAGGPEC